MRTFFHYAFTNRMWMRKNGKIKLRCTREWARVSERHTILIHSATVKCSFSYWFFMVVLHIPFLAVNVRYAHSPIELRTIEWKQQKEGRKTCMAKTIFELWFIAALYTRLLPVCSRFIRWLFAGKHFLINYTVQSAILVIRVHSRPSCAYAAVVVVAVVIVAAAATVFVAIFSIPLIFFPLPLFRRFLLASVCVRWRIGTIFTIQYTVCVCVCAGVHINNPSLKIRQQVLSSM